MTLRIAIIGTGSFAKRIADAVTLTPDMSVSAVVSGSQDRASSFASAFSPASAYTSISNVKDAGAADAVLIANATQNHATSAIEAMEAGFPVLCEKPFATSVEEGEQVLACAAKTSALFTEDLWTLTLPAVRGAIGAAKTSLGPLHHLRADFSITASPETHPRLFKGAAPGALLDLGVYPISLAVAVNGPVTDISGLRTDDENGVDIASALTLRHDNDALSQVSCALNAQGSNDAAIAGRGGRVRIPEPLLGAERFHVALNGEPQPSDGSSSGGLKARIKANPLARKAKSALDGLKATTASYGTDQYTPMLQHFHELVRAGTTESPLVPHALSRETLRIISAARAL
ncbi:MAG: Gfo/Idh/MocA family oxidoreductase [Pseudomonadota bacterium]